MITADQLKDIQDRAEALHKYLDIDKKRMEYEEEDLRTQAPDFWEDPERAQAQMKLVKDIKRWIDGYDEVRAATDEVALAMEFYRDEMATEEEVDKSYERAIHAIEELEMRNMLRQKEDPMDCVLKINAGYFDCVHRTERQFDGGHHRRDADFAAYERNSGNGVFACRA